MWTESIEFGYRLLSTGPSLFVLAVNYAQHFPVLRSTALCMRKNSWDTPWPNSETWPLRGGPWRTILNLISDAPSLQRDGITFTQDCQRGAFSGGTPEMAYFTFMPVPSMLWVVCNKTSLTVLGGQERKRRLYVNHAYTNYSLLPISCKFNVVMLNWPTFDAKIACKEVQWPKALELSIKASNKGTPSSLRTALYPRALQDMSPEEGRVGESESQIRPYRFSECN